MRCRNPAEKPAETINAIRAKIPTAGISRNTQRDLWSIAKPQRGVVNLLEHRTMAKRRSGTWREVKCLPENGADRTGTAPWLTIKSHRLKLSGVHHGCGEQWIIQAHSFSSIRTEPDRQRS